MEKLILLIIIFSPLLMSLILMNPLFKENERVIRRTAKGFGIFHLLLNGLFISFYDFSNFNYQYITELKVFNINWIDLLGIKACFAVDSLSLMFMSLTSFIFLISIFYSKHTVKKSYQLYYSLILMLETAVLGIFSSMDMLLFFLFWELELIPMYILLLKWGSGNRQKTALKFLLYTFIGSIFILLGFLILYVYNNSISGVLTSSFQNIDISYMSKNFQSLLFVLFFIGFGVKLPIIPIHNWLPDTHSQAPSPVSIILSSILLKIGAYGILKFNYGLLNDTFREFVQIIVLFAVINLIYAGVCAIVQKDIKRIVAYSGISHMGIFLLGLCAFNVIGVTGAIFQLFSHALISAGLFAMTGIIYIRCGTKNILRIQGLGSRMPKLMYSSVFIILAGIGVPLTSGFISEFLTFVGVISSDVDSFFIKGISIFAILTLLITSIYLLKIFHSLFFGKMLEKYNQIRDVDNNNFVILSILILYIMLFGIFPYILTNTIADYSISTYNLGGMFNVDY